MAKIRKAAKKMTTGKKVAIGVGVAAVIGAILCYFYCPCFKKKEEATPEPGYGTDEFIPPPDMSADQTPAEPPVGTNPGTGGSPSMPKYGMPSQLQQYEPPVTADPLQAKLHRPVVII